MTGLVALASIGTYDIGGAAAATVYAATEGFNAPDAPGYFPGDIVTLPTFVRAIDGVLALEAATRSSELVLANADGRYDFLADDALEGWTLTLALVLRGETYASRVVWFTGTMAAPEFRRHAVALRLRDRSSELDMPLNETRYDGSNSLPDGLEGTPDDIAGRQKPVFAGAPFNVAPPMVNASRFIFQFHDGSGADIDASVGAQAGVFDGGVGLEREADYASQAAMESTPPTAGKYKVWPGGGCFRTGSKPAFGITCDPLYGAAAARTAAQSISRFAQRASTIGAGDVSSSDVTALDSDNGSAIGWWPNGDETIRTACRAAAASVGAWFGFDRFGVLRMGRIEAPENETASATLRERSAAAPVATDGEISLIEIEGVSPADDDTPTWQLLLEHTENFTPQRDGLDAAITADRRAVLAERWRHTAPVEPAGVRTKWPLAQARTMESWLVENAATEASRRATILSVPRRRWSVRARLSQTLAAAIDLGAVVKLITPRYGMSAGRNHVVIRIAHDGRSGVAEMTLWG